MRRFAVRRFWKWRPKNESTWLIKTLKKDPYIKQNRTWFGIHGFITIINYMSRNCTYYIFLGPVVCVQKVGIYSAQPDRWKFKRKKIRVVPVWLWNQFQCKKCMVGVPAHPKDLYPVAKTADFRETYWWLKMGYHFGNQGFIHRTQIDRQWWKFSRSWRCSTNEKGFSIWFTLFYYFFIFPFALCWMKNERSVVINN